MLKNCKNSKKCKWRCRASLSLPLVCIVSYGDHTIPDHYMVPFHNTSMFWCNPTNFNRRCYAASMYGAFLHLWVGCGARSKDLSPWIGPYIMTITFQSTYVLNQILNMHHNGGNTHSKPQLARGPHRDKFFYGGTPSTLGIIGTGGGSFVLLLMMLCNRRCCLHA
jgi:hypothetical protein